MCTAAASWSRAARAAQTHESMPPLTSTTARDFFEVVTLGQIAAEILSRLPSPLDPKRTYATAALSGPVHRPQSSTPPVPADRAGNASYRGLRSHLCGIPERTVPHLLALPDCAGG